MTQELYHKKWQSVALLMMLVGTVGSVLNIIVFMLDFNLFSGFMGVLGLMIWYLIYRRKFLGLVLLNVLILINLAMLFGKILFTEVSFHLIGDIILRVGFLFYFNYQVLEGMFEV